MSMKRIREVYGVPAKRGALVRFQGTLCRITSADRSDMYLWICSLAMPWLRMKVHPTWEMDYDITEGDGE